MNPNTSEPSRVISPRHAGLSELRQSILTLGYTASLDDELVLESAQHVVDEARKRIFVDLQDNLDDDQVRYFQQVLKTMKMTVGDRLELPEYADLVDSSKDCQVALKQDSAKNALDRQSSGDA